MSKPRGEDDITEVVRDQMKKANSDAEVHTQVPIKSPDGKKKTGQIDLLWCSGGTYVAMEAGFEGDNEVHKEALSRLGIKVGKVAIENVVSVQYPNSLKDPAELVALATFQVCHFRSDYSDKKMVIGTKALAGVLDGIAQNAT